eukprot:5459787-Pyramimonas_sp.AAC.1
MTKPQALLIISAVYMGDPNRLFSACWPHALLRGSCFSKYLSPQRVSASPAGASPIGKDPEAKRPPSASPPTSSSSSGSAPITPSSS